MRTRQDAVKSRPLSTLLALACLACGTGCGAVFHSSQTVTVATKKEDKAIVYQGGVPLTATEPGRFQTTVFLNSPMGEIVAVAPGKRIKRVVLERHVDVAAIVCDVLWTLTIVGVAAPISDALLGTFVKTQSEVDANLETDQPSNHPMPVYSLYGTTVVASEQVTAPVVPKVEAPPADAPKSEPVPPPPPKTGKGEGKPPRKP